MVLYEDSGILLDETGLTLKRYYFPTAGAKHVAYSDIRGFDARAMSWWSGKGRWWGTGHPGYWFPLDVKRSTKTTMLVLDLGARVKPCISPDDPEQVLDLLRGRTGLS